MNGLLVQPDPRRKRLQITVEAPDAAQISLEIAGTDVRYTGPPGAVSIPLADFTPWAPGAPHLYTLTCHVPDGAAAGTFAIPFGMREVSVIEHRVCINQKPLVLKGARLARAAGEATVLAEMEALLRAGFTWLRCAADVANEPLLTAASALGLPVTVELAASDRAIAAAHVGRFFNFAAVIAWECADDATAEVVRTLDPTRPVFAPGRAFRPYQNAPEPVTRLCAGVLTPISRETETLLARAGDAQALNLIDMRGFAPPPADAGAPALGDRAALELHVAGSIRACIDGLRSNPRLAGYCFEDALVADNAVRLAAFGEAQAAVRPVITMTRSNLVPREEADVTVTLLNDARVEGRGELSLQVVGPTNQVLWKKKRGVKLPKHGKELWSGTVAASGSVGMHRFVVRVLDERGAPIGGSSVSFHVSPAVEKWTSPIDVLDPAGRWLESIKRLAPQIDAMAAIVIVPPLASSVRAFPDNPLGHVLGRVRDGAVGLVFEPAEDWHELAATLSSSVDVNAGRLLDGAPCGSLALARLHPMFEGLPAGGPLARPYRGLLNDDALTGESEEDISPVTVWDGDVRTGHRVLVRRFGAGRLMFVSMRILERLGNDPVVDRMFVNLLRHSERRAVATKEIAKVEPRAIEWLRQERSKLRVWRVIGPFANWDGEGHDTAYPPEGGYDADATYAGWYRAAAWQTWHQRTGDGDEVPLSRLLRPDMVRVAPYPGTFYAYTDLTSEERLETRFTLAHAGRAKCWVNARPVNFETPPGGDAPGASVVLKQGRNAVLVKISATDSAAAFSLRVRDDAGLRWL